MTVLVDIDENHRNKHLPNGLLDNGNGHCMLEIEEVAEVRNGLPVEGFSSLTGSDPIIDIETEDIVLLKKRGPKKVRLYNHDVRPPRM